ncbi:hypothetical protein DL95DRAFT_409338 [Leptodontidium sp. 2 PMI_412]|nr:hypothetical protein DL95DRAFT_409338 [Leptodontidium sp. 2 PMI_412]
MAVHFLRYLISSRFSTPEGCQGHDKPGMETFLSSDEPFRKVGNNESVDTKARYCIALYCTSYCAFTFAPLPLPLPKVQYIAQGNVNKVRIVGRLTVRATRNKDQVEVEDMDVEDFPFPRSYPVASVLVLRAEETSVQVREAGKIQGRGEELQHTLPSLLYCKEM